MGRNEVVACTVLSREAWREVCEEVSFVFKDDMRLFIRMCAHEGVCIMEGLDEVDE